MNKQVKRLGLVAVLGGGLMASAQAADANATITKRQEVLPVGMSPQIGYVEATAAASASTQGMRVELPFPDGYTTGDLLGFVGRVETTGGAGKPVTIVTSGTAVLVSSSNQTSGTLAVGDVLKGIAVFKPQ